MTQTGSVGVISAGNAAGTPARSESVPDGFGWQGVFGRESDGVAQTTLDVYTPVGYIYPGVDIPVTVAEIDPFESTARRAGLTEDERYGLVDYLARHPEKGDLIPGTGGLRKLRWSKGGRGKRSGYRAIYYFFSEDFPICLLAIYPKNQRVNLSAEQRKQLSAQADTLKEAFRATVRKRSMR